VAAMPAPGGLSLRPVKTRGESNCEVHRSAVAGCYCLSLLYSFCILCSNVSLFPLYPVQCKFIANCSDDGNINSHSAFSHLQFA